MPPEVKFVDSGSTCTIPKLTSGYNAIAHATINSSQQVTDCVMDWHGAGFTSTPTVLFCPVAGGSGPTHMNTHLTEFNTAPGAANSSVYGLYYYGFATSMIFSGGNCLLEPQAY